MHSSSAFLVIEKIIWKFDRFFLANVSCCYSVVIIFIFQTNSRVYSYKYAGPVLFWVNKQGMTRILKTCEILVNVHTIFFV